MRSIRIYFLFILISFTGSVCLYSCWFAWICKAYLFTQRHFFIGSIHCLPSLHFINFCLNFFIIIFASFLLSFFFLFLFYKILSYIISLAIWDLSGYIAIEAFITINFLLGKAMVCSKHSGKSYFHFYLIIGTFVILSFSPMTHWSFKSISPCLQAFLLVVLSSFVPLWSDKIK